MPPSDKLLATFKAAIADFNNATTDKDYHKFKEYLYSYVVIDKVDDIDRVEGSPDQIVDKYLNPYEAANGNFPQFYDGGSPRATEHESKNGVLIGEITGEGTYWDTYADKSKKGTPVQYTLRFVKPNGQNKWLLFRAVVVPIG
ncbi:MAG: hypothetical protein JO189_14490 [Deltaproteobacteria bacterium]|nr:hypothetical protein [Deltaproteobacteria bacterium]